MEPIRTSVKNTNSENGKRNPRTKEPTPNLVVHFFIYLVLLSLVVLVYFVMLLVRI